MESSPEIDTANPTVMRCSFCDKPHYQVRNLVAGPRVFICDVCINAFNKIIEEASFKDAPSPAARLEAMARIAREATRKLKLLAGWSASMEEAANAATEGYPAGGDTRH